MVLTRSQKKSQVSNLENTSNVLNISNEQNKTTDQNDILHSYQTRSKGDIKNINESNNDNNINNEKLDSLEYSKYKSKNSNLKNKNKLKLQDKPKTQNSSGLIPITIPMNLLFFNMNKQSHLKKEVKNENEDENEDEEIGCGDKNCEGCDLCEENDEDYDDDDDEEDDDYDEELDEFFSFTKQIKEIKNKIPDLKISDQLKDKLLSMLKSSNLDDKRMEWFDTLTKIPFGEYSKYDVDINDIENTKNYIKNIYQNLDQSVWGLNDVKEEILNYVTQCITQPESKPRVLALCGQPGIGKTKIVRDGISKSLNREMRCFSMGGIKDSSTFLGFDYTYVGSKYGAIVQSLIDCKTMNPILFFDELDKISDTKEGQDIENLLIHLTDPVQNYDFNDKYFNGIPIDLSKCLLIFSFNEPENISPILRDRLHIVTIQNPSVKDKVNIASKFFIKEFLNNFKLNENEVIFKNEIIKYIIDRYTNDESGVRKLKRCIETICMKLNTSKLLGNTIKELNLSTSKIDIQFPIELNREQVDILLHVKENNKNDKIPFMYI